MMHFFNWEMFSGKPGEGMLCAALLAALLCSGCKTTGSQTQSPQNPFYGQTTVPPPGTGSYQGPATPSSPQLPPANPGGASVYVPPSGSSNAPPSSNSLFGYDGNPAGPYVPPSGTPMNGSPTYPSGGSGGQYNNGNYGGYQGNPASTWNSNGYPTDSRSPNSSREAIGGNPSGLGNRYAPGSTSDSRGYGNQNPGFSGSNAANPYRNGGNRSYENGGPSSNGYDPGPSSTFPSSTSPYSPPSTSDTENRSSPYLNTNGRPYLEGTDTTNYSGNRGYANSRWQPFSSAPNQERSNGFNASSSFFSSNQSPTTQPGDQVEIPLSARRTTTADRSQSEFSSTFYSNIWEAESERDAEFPSSTSDQEDRFVAVSSEQQTLVRAASPEPVPSRGQPAYGGSQNRSPDVSAERQGVYDPAVPLGTTSGSSGASRKVDLKDLAPATTQCRPCCPPGAVVACHATPLIVSSEGKPLTWIPTSKGIPCQPISPCGGYVLYYD